MSIQYKNKPQALHTKTNNNFSDNLNLQKKIVTAAFIIEANDDNIDDDFSQFENPVLDRLIDRSNLKVTPNIYRGQKNPDGTRNADINLDELRLALRSLSTASDFLEFENRENSILQKVLHIIDVSITTHHYNVISQACGQIPDLIASLTNNIKILYQQGYRAGDLSNEKFLKKVVESNDYQFYDEFDRAFKSNLAVRIIEADKRFFEKAFEIKRLPESLLQEVDEAIDSLMTINSAQQWLEDNLSNPFERNGKTTFLFHEMINAVIANLRQVAENQKTEREEQAKANKGIQKATVGDLYTYRRGTVVILDRSQRMLQIQGVDSKKYIIINDKYFYNSGNVIAVANNFESNHTNERISNITRGIIYTDKIRPVVTIESRKLVADTNTYSTKALLMSRITPAAPIMLYNNLEMSLKQINTIEENLKFLVSKDLSQITRYTNIILHNIAKNIPINDLTQLMNNLDLNFESLAKKLINDQAGKQIQSKFPQQQLIDITQPKDIVENIITALARKFGETAHAVGYKPSAKTQQEETRKIKAIENEIREQIGDNIKLLIENHDHEQLFKALKHHDTDLMKLIIPVILNIAKKFASDVPEKLRTAIIFNIFRWNIPVQENIDNAFTDDKTKNINVANSVVSDIINNISNNFKQLSIDEINKIIGVDMSKTLESLYDIKKQVDTIKDDITKALKSLVSVSTLIMTIRRDDTTARVKLIVKNISKSIDDTINNFTAILNIIPQLDQRLNANNDVLNKIEKTIKSINIIITKNLEELTNSVNHIDEVYDVDKPKSTLLKDLTRVKQMFNDEINMLNELITNMAKSKNQSAISVLEYIKIVNNDIERISIAIKNKQYAPKILNAIEHLKHSINYINLNINSLYKSPEARNAQNKDDSKVSTSNYDNVIKCINAQAGLENARILVQLEQPFDGVRLQIVASKNHKKMNKKG